MVFSGRCCPINMPAAKPESGREWVGIVRPIVGPLIHRLRGRVAKIEHQTEPPVRLVARGLATERRLKWVRPVGSEYLVYAT